MFLPLLLAAVALHLRLYPALRAFKDRHQFFYLLHLLVEDMGQLGLQARQMAAPAVLAVELVH